MRRKTAERYIKIYTLYSLGSKTEQQISEELGIDKRTVIAALKWVDENRINIPSEQFMRIEIDTARRRKQELREDMENAREAKNWNAVVAFHREIKSNDELEMKLRGLLGNVESKPSMPSIHIETLNVFVDTLVKIFNEINELDTPEKRRKAFAERLSKLNWPEIREPDRSLAGKQIRGRLPGYKLRN